MDLSILIVSWNCRADLLNCLASLIEGARGVEHEILLIDNASSDDTCRQVATQYPRVIMTCNQHNAGFAGGNVQAMTQAQGQYLLLLNPDTLVPPDGLRKLLDFAKAHPEAGIIGPKLVYGDGRLQHSCRNFPTITAAIFRNTFIGSLFPHARAKSTYLMEDWDHSEMRSVDWISGACMLVRRECFEQIGPLDTGFFWGSEDVDYCWRAHKANWQVLYTPEPVITHLVGRSTDKARLRTIIRTHRSMYRLYSKHIARNFLERGLVWLGVWLRAGLIVIHLFFLRLHDCLPVILKPRQKKSET